MKKILLATTLLMGSVLTTTSSNAQVRVTINANIGRQPIWGPAGYDFVQFYYLPALDVFYDVQAAQFVYFDRGRWTYGYNLPYYYGNYNLFNTYKVVINRPEPFLRAKYYRRTYGGYRNYYNHQLCIRDSRDPRYGGWDRDHYYNNDDRFRNHDHDFDRDHDGDHDRDDHDHR